MELEIYECGGVANGRLYSVTPANSSHCLARRSAPLRTKKRFSTDVCKHIPVENFFGSLDTGQAGLECQPVVCCYLVQYHRCVIHVCELCDGGIVLVTRASY